MNQHINTMKTAIMTYYSTAKAAYNRMYLDKQQYLPSVAKDLEIKEREGLKKARDEVLAIIDQAQLAGMAESAARDQLRGEDITADAQLLDGRLQLTNDDVGQLIERHRENYTMRRLIRDYLVKQNRPLDLWPLMRMDDAGSQARWAKIGAEAAQTIESIYNPDQADAVRRALMDQIINNWGDNIQI